MALMVDLPLLIQVYEPEMGPGAQYKGRMDLTKQLVC